MRKILLNAVLLVALVACDQNLKVSNDTQADQLLNQRVDSVLTLMTINEKIGQLNLLTAGHRIPTGAVVSTDVETKIKDGKVGGLFGLKGPEKIRRAQKIAVEGSRLKIPLLFGLDVIHGYKTVFPIPLALSCSWDMNLIEKTARIAATEATSDGICWNFSPMVDVSRDPRWGRVAEGAGEDPYLGAQISKAMVKGYQLDDLTAKHTMMATVKHFALYGASESGRDYNTVDMSRLRMFNDYLLPYKAAIDAGVGCVMTSFNDVEGIPASANKWLITDLLRDRWDFGGFVVSDYTSVNEMIAHGMGDLQTVSALAINAGLDMDMVGEGFLTTLEKSLSENKISEEKINTACRRILAAKYKLGLFDDPYRYIDDSLPGKEILTKATRKAAREVASNSFVLLKNDDNTLPLKKSGTIALVGPLADSKNNMLGTWAVAGNPQLSIPVLEGMQNVAADEVKIIYAKGANITNDSVLAKKINAFRTLVDIDSRSPDVLLREAISVARKADVIVAVIGEATEMSGESSSRTDITLPASQKKLVRALAKTGKPLVLVMMSGRPLAMGEEDELASAILQTWHPGIEGGNAIADVLFGAVNPSGKITATFPQNVGQIPLYYNYKNTGRPLPEGVAHQKFTSNYLDVSNEPLYPFGYGLSYSSFEYSKLKLSTDTLKADDKLLVTINVSNTGAFAGKEIIQLYIRDLVGTVTRPVKELKGFKKVNIKQGETAAISFEIAVEDLSFYNYDLDYIYEPGEFEVFVGANSRDLLSAKFELIK